MLFQCSARLTLIWLSGSALLPCQPVRGMVKLFEGGLSWGVACLCQAETRLRGCKTSVCSQTPTQTLPHLLCSLPQPAFHSLRLLPQSLASFFSLFPFPLSSFHFLCLTHAGTATNTHICTHFLLFLSEASLKELWPCGLEEVQTPPFCWVFPQTTKTQNCNVDVDWMPF